MEINTNINHTNIEIVLHTKTYLQCFHCEYHEAFDISYISQLTDDHENKGWACNKCGEKIEVKYTAATKNLEIGPSSEIPHIVGWLLVKLNAKVKSDEVYFVLKDHHLYPENYPNEPNPIQAAIAGLTYYVNEHTCPSNLLRFSVIDGVGAKYDDDPHGILEFVAFAPYPADFDVNDTRHSSGDYDWREIFPILTDTIEGNITTEIKVIESK